MKCLCRVQHSSAAPIVSERSPLKHNPSASLPNRQAIIGINPANSGKNLQHASFCIAFRPLLIARAANESCARTAFGNVVCIHLAPKLPCRVQAKKETCAPSAISCRSSIVFRMPTQYELTKGHYVCGNIQQQSRFPAPMIGTR